MFQLNWQYDNNYDVTRFWIGQFWATIVVHHPNGLKNVNVLKCILKG